MLKLDMDNWQDLKKAQKIYKCKKNLIKKIILGSTYRTAKLERALDLITQCMYRNHAHDDDLNYLQALLLKYQIESELGTHAQIDTAANIGKFYEKILQFEQALFYYQDAVGKILEVNPSRVYNYYIIIINMYSRARLYDKVIEHCLIYINKYWNFTSNINKPAIYKIMADTYFEKGDYADADSYYNHYSANILSGDKTNIVYSYVYRLILSKIASYDIENYGLIEDYLNTYPDFLQTPDGIFLRNLMDLIYERKPISDIIHEYTKYQSDENKQVFSYIENKYNLNVF